MAHPKIVTRAEWGAKSATEPYTAWVLPNPTGHTVHWEGAGGHRNHSLCVAEVRAIQLYHLSHGYIDIAYNWIVCMHGVIFEGRPIVFESAAQKVGNPFRIAICYMAGPAWPFSQAARAAVAWLITQNATPTAIPHQDEPSCITSCAGAEINPWVRSGAWHADLPHIVPKPAPAPKPKPLPLSGLHHPTLAINSDGAAVLELQVKLNVVAGQHLVLDGQFGPATAAAVRNFQGFFHLKVDGVAGPATWGMLDFIWYHRQK
jgi:peptidoglycan hydrolase-like protein with peptidoglycan-binding domain